MFELPITYELRQEGDKFFIVNIHTAWESDRFGLQDVLVLRSGLDQNMKSVFNMRRVIK